MSGIGQTQSSTGPVSTPSQSMSSGQPMSVAASGRPMIPAGQQPMMMAAPQPVPVRYVAGPQGGMVYMPQPVNECILYVIICFVSRLRWPNQLIVVFFQVII